MKKLLFALTAAGLLFASAPAFACGGDKTAEKTSTEKEAQKHAGVCDQDCGCDKKNKKAEGEQKKSTKKSDEPA